MNDKDLEGTAPVSTTLSSRAGVYARIGRFSIMDVVGEGGMGTVYAAYDDQLDRRVALKRLKGDPSVEAQRRILREAQAMARLSHPNVVPVFEVGDDDAGLYVAMEFVDGLTLAAWKRVAPRGWREIVEKYLGAGRGLVAAHAAGLVHRDFKPGNVMVGEDGRPRVLDFGIAGSPKVIGRMTGGDAPSLHDSSDNELMELGSLTDVGTVVGTPAYMAPEQRRGAAVDARADQYAFCVALWEALFDERPTDVTRSGRRAAWSTAVSTQRAVPAVIRSALLRGLSDDPNERWPDLKALLDQLRRPLNAPSRRRRRWLAGGFAATFLGGVFAVQQVGDWQATQKASRCLSEAEAQRSDVWGEDVATELRHAFAATGLAYANATATSAVQVVDDYAREWTDTATAVCIASKQTPSPSHLTPESCLGDRMAALSMVLERLTVADIEAVTRASTALATLPSIALCEDADYLAGRAEDSPGQRGARRSLRETLLQASLAGLTHHPKESLELAREARALAEGAGLSTLVPASQLGLGAALLGLGEHLEAERELEAAYFGGLNQGDFDTAAAAATLLLELVGQRLDRHDDGLLWGEHAAYAIGQLVPAEAAERTAVLQTHRGRVHLAAGNFQLAIEAQERALSSAEELFGPSHPRVGRVLEYLSDAARENGDYARATQLAERALDIAVRTHGPEHPRVAAVLETLGAVRTSIADYDAALLHDRRALEILAQAYGPTHPLVASMEANLASVFLKTGRRDEAIALLKRSIATVEANTEPLDPAVATPMTALAVAYARGGELKKARVLTEQALRRLETAFGSDHIKVAYVRSNLASMLKNTGEPQRALEQYALALPVLRRVGGDASEAVGMNLMNTGNVQRELGQPARARVSLDRALECFEQAMGPAHPQVALAHYNRGNLADSQGQTVAARADYEKASSLLGMTKGLQPGEVEAAVGLATLSQTRGQREQAVLVLERTLAAIPVGEAGDGDRGRLQRATRRLGRSSR